MKKRLFGRTEDGRAVEEVVLESADAAVAVLSYGCVVRDWRVDSPGGSLPMVLGFPPYRGLRAPFRLARRHRRAGRQPDRRVALHARRHDLSADAERGAEPAARRRRRARPTGLADGGRQQRGRSTARLHEPGRRGGLSRRRRLRRHLPPRGAAARLRDARRPRPADADQPRQPQLLQPRRRRHGAGPPALGRRRGLHPDRRCTDPERRDPPGRGTPSSTSPPSGRSATPASTSTSCCARGATRSGRRPACSARGPGCGSSSGPTSRGCSSSTPPR